MLKQSSAVHNKVLHSGRDSVGIELLAYMDMCDLLKKECGNIV